MAEQTSLVAQQVRLMHWAEQIRECQNRLEGMDVSTWCEQNNITKANYYYPLKRVRQMYLDQLPEGKNSNCARSSSDVYQKQKWTFGRFALIKRIAIVQMPLSHMLSYFYNLYIPFCILDSCKSTIPLI